MKTRVASAEAKNNWLAAMGAFAFAVAFWGAEMPLPALADPDVQTEAHSAPKLAKHCVDCHMTKSNLYVMQKNKTKLYHDAVHLKHSRAHIECGSCHDRNNHNLLRSSAAQPASFEASSGVCQQCHQDRYKDWQNGIHGKRMGGWKGPKTAFQCIHCHEPHNVRFKQMQAQPAPQAPRLLKRKSEEAE